MLKNCFGSAKIFDFLFFPRHFIHTLLFFNFLPMEQYILKHHFEKRKRNKSKLLSIQKMS